LAAVIFVSLGTVEFGNKGLTWNAKHGVEYARIRDAPGAELRVDHSLTGGDGHWVLGANLRG
jgi:hypothetical protein